MTQETIIYNKIINNITYIRTDLTQFKDGKQIRFERTYKPSIKFGLEIDKWNKINKEFNIINK